MKRNIKTHTIKVTKEHIKNGIVHCGDSCPVALALIDEFGTGCGIAVGTLDIDIYEKTCPLPEKVTRFIHRFDDQEPVRPFKFNIQI